MALPGADVSKPIPKDPNFRGRTGKTCTQKPCALAWDPKVARALPPTGREKSCKWKLEVRNGRRYEVPVK